MKISNIKLASLVAAGLMVAAVDAHAITVPPDNAPNVQAQANTLRRPFGLQPANSVQLGVMQNAGGPGSAGFGSQLVYDALKNYFSGYNVGPNTMNWDRSNRFSLANGPALTQVPNPFPMNQVLRAHVYFVDSGITTTGPNALGITNPLNYTAPIATTPDINTVSFAVPPFSTVTHYNPINGPMADTGLLFPYAASAMGNNVPSQPNIGRNVESLASWGANDLAAFGKEFPLLFSDSTIYNVPTGQSIDLFLMRNIWQFRKDSSTVDASNLLATQNGLVPWDALGGQQVDPQLTWTTDVIHNTFADKWSNTGSFFEPIWTNTGISAALYDHFRFYELPALEGDNLFKNAYLVAVDGGYHGGVEASAPFDDLFFVIGVVPVPEPQTYLIVGSLLFVAFFFSRKRVRA